MNDVMRILKAVIVDDERLARNELRRLLARHPEIDIVGEASSAQQAREALDDLEPDLVFLDVQMPGETGFDLLASLDSVPLVVFTTAFDEYALRAFEVSALDYLVKPIDPKRLARTVERLHAMIQHTPEPGTMASVADTAAARGRIPANAKPLSEHHRVFVNEGERCWLVELGDIRLFEAAGNYTRIFFGKETPLINRGLNQLEPKLDGRVFFRANRHQIVNVKAVRDIQAWFGGRLLARIDGGAEVTISRRRARVFRELMGM
jgi:two-component system LytT family response regulator